MNEHPILTALSSRSIAALVRQAQRRVVYAAPGIHPFPAAALAELASRLPLSSITISLDFDEHTLRMGKWGREELRMVVSFAFAVCAISGKPPVSRVTCLIVSNCANLPPGKRFAMVSRSWSIMHCNTVNAPRALMWLPNIFHD